MLDKHVPTTGCFNSSIQIVLVSLTCLDDNQNRLAPLGGCSTPRGGFGSSLAHLTLRMPCI